MRKKGSSKIVKVYVSINNTALEELEDYRPKKSQTFTDCVREGIRLQLKTGFTITKDKKSADIKRKQIRLTVSEHEELVKTAKEMGIAIQTFTGGCLVKLLQARGYTGGVVDDEKE